MLIWCNGQWLEEGNFPSSVMDRGFTLGLGLFETLLALDGRPVFLARHLTRLSASCERLGWQVSFADFQAIATRLLELNDLTKSRARLRIAVTAGSGPLGDIRQGTDAQLWMTAHPLTDLPAPLTAILCPWPRNERSPLAGLKCASYAENLFALDHARRLGFGESIFLNTTGHLCEAATANIFLVKNGILLTPSLASGCLPGIAREIVLEIATCGKITNQECDLTLKDLENADEVFLTSSLRGIQRVTKIGDQAYLAEGVTAQLSKAWEKATESEISSHSQRPHS